MPAVAGPAVGRIRDLVSLPTHPIAVAAQTSGRFVSTVRTGPSHWHVEKRPTRCRTRNSGKRYRVGKCHRPAARTSGDRRGFLESKAHPGTVRSEAVPLRTMRTRPDRRCARTIHRQIDFATETRHRTASGTPCRRRRGSGLISARPLAKVGSGSNDKGRQACHPRHRQRRSKRFHRGLHGVFSPFTIMNRAPSNYQSTCPRNTVSQRAGLLLGSGPYFSRRAGLEMINAPNPMHRITTAYEMTQTSFLLLSSPGT